MANNNFNKDKFSWNYEKGAQLMTMDETADYLRIAKSTLYGYVFKKKIPVVKVGQKNLFDKAIINAWLLERMS